MEGVFRTVLLVALPASGKSEVRNFMAQMDPARLSEEFHIGHNLQLDDFPYVHIMRRIDEELVKLGEPHLFYRSLEKPFRNDYDWGTLTQLLNEDYHDLIGRVRVTPQSDAMYLFERIDRAGMMAGIAPRMAMLDAELREKIAAALEDEARGMREEKEAQYTDDFTGKTIVIECARGGADGSPLPLRDPFGYQYTMRMFSPDLLEDAAILYIWVTPQESRRKNNERANPDDPGSNLFHGVPMEVMLGDYGTDDMQYLMEHAERKHTLTVTQYERTLHVPIGGFDNRVDKTSFLRGDKADWEEERIAEVTEAIREATDTMWAHYGDNAIEHFTDVEVVDSDSVQEEDELQ